MRKHIVKITACILLAYIILGATLPLAWHKQAGSLVRQNFIPSLCYAEEPGAERILCIDDNMDALLWRIRVIESAQEEIILSTFDFGNDESGQDIMALLLHAADRGVSVRIIVDGANGMLKLSGSSSFHALISHPNVEAKLYNPVNPLLPWKMTLRLHDKYLIADDSIYILGGRNTNDLFLGNYRENYNMDRELLVYETGSEEDNSMSRLKDYFAEIWALPCNKEMTDTGTGERVSTAGNDLRDRYRRLTESYPEAFENTDFHVSTIETNSVTLLTGSPEPVNKNPDLWYMLCRLMSEGEEVLVQSPYIVCSREMYGDLTELCDNAKVELIINAAESGANPWGCTDYLNQRRRIRETGIETYERMGAQSSHTKTILIDDHISIVGSYNLDMRSTYLDTESMLVVDCEQLNRELWDSAERDMEECRHIYPDGTYEYGSLYEPQKNSIWKRMLYVILRVVTPPIRHML